MSISIVSALQSVMATQLSGMSGAHHHRAANGLQQNASTGIGSLSSLLGAMPAAASTAISTASSLLNSLPGFSSDTTPNPTNILV
jgi:hypothetical protein